MWRQATGGHGLGAHRRWRSGAARAAAPAAGGIAGRGSVGDPPDATALAAEVRAGMRSALALAAETLERAEASRCNAYWTLDCDGARHAAEEVDRITAEGDDAGPLAGVPVAIKDCFDLAGMPTTSGVPGESPPAPTSAEAVRRLRRAGAVPVGKAALDQLTWSTFALAPGFPTCRNPVDAQLTPGGSSSGSAAAVAGGLAALGLGTDTAGSIRIPAACCGLIGMKPPSGWIPLEGAATFAPSFECGGVLARSLRDCVTAVEVLAGRRIPDAPPGKLSVGLIEDELAASGGEVAECVLRAAEALREAGVEVVPARLACDMPGMGTILAAELLRTWGDQVARAPELYDEEVRGSIAYAGRLSDYDRARARIELERESREVASRLGAYTAVLGPTMHFPTPPADDPGTVAEMTAATRPFNALGWPALSLPAGTDGSGRPIAVQVAAPPRNLGGLVRLASLLAT